MYYETCGGIMKLDNYQKQFILTEAQNYRSWSGKSLAQGIIRVLELHFPLVCNEHKGKLTDLSFCVSEDDTLEMFNKHYVEK